MGISLLSSAGRKTLPRAYRLGFLSSLHSFGNTSSQIAATSIQKQPRQRKMKSILTTPSPPTRKPRITK